jgi:alpha-1,6-mannosyltransferase
MKIIHIANFYGPKSGGIKTTLHNLGTGYINQGHDFTYIVPGAGLHHEKTPHGIRITVPSFMIPFTGGYRIIKSNRQIRNMLLALSPDRIEVSDRFTLSSVGRWAKSRKITTLVFSHETLRGLIKTYLPFSAKKFVAWHNQRLANSFDYVIATTKFASSEFVAIGSKNLVQVPLGVDLKTFSPKNRDLELRTKLLKGGEILLVHCGRLSPEKKPERSIQALRELLQRGVNARLIYVGTGPLHKKLYESSRDIPVTFLGYISDKKYLASVVASADVSIAPGPIETFCLSALESLASGTPVVASNTSAVGEFLLTNSNDFVGQVAANNGKDFADSIEIVIERLKSDETLRSRCHHQAENFPWSSTISQMLSLGKKPNIHTLQAA